jgi:hypothetical protein
MRERAGMSAERLAAIEFEANPPELQRICEATGSAESFWPINHAAGPRKQNHTPAEIFS